MRLARLELRHIALPLKKRIKHASHERASSDSFVVRAVLNNGVVGHGEGVPRDYVTGETIDSCFDSFQGVDLFRDLGDPDSFEAVVDFLEQWTLPSIASDPRGMMGNAARCAFEIAILDAYGRAFGRTLGEVIRLSSAGRSHALSSPRPVRYSGAITADGQRKEVIAAIKQRVYGFRQMKVKVAVPGQDDPRRLARFRAILGPRIDLRIDANEGWTPDELLDRVEPLRPFRPSALEQPIPHELVGRLAELRPRLGIPVMLDESLCGEPDGRHAIKNGLADIFNVRISKCGGLLPTLRLIGMAYQAGLGVQLGCHPGESAILSAAGRHLACSLPGFRYLEGSYDRHVLSDNVTAADLTFGYGGKAMPLSGTGLGIEIDPDRLDDLTRRHSELSDA